MMTPEEVQAIARLLDRPIAFDPFAADLMGSVSGGVFLCQALYWQKNCPDEDNNGNKRNGWWWKTDVDWHKETRLLPAELRAARKKLTSSGLGEWKMMGLPAKPHYRLDIAAIIQAALTIEPRSPKEKKLPERGEKGEFQSSVKRRTGDPSDGEQADRPSEDMPSGGRRDITETTPETSPQITTTTDGGGGCCDSRDALEGEKGIDQQTFPEAGALDDLPDTDRKAVSLIIQQLGSEQQRRDVLDTLLFNIKECKVRETTGGLARTLARAAMAGTLTLPKAVADARRAREVAARREIEQQAKAEAKAAEDALHLQRVEEIMRKMSLDEMRDELKDKFPTAVKMLDARGLAGMIADRGAA